MIQVPIKTLVAKVPRLTDDGKRFYKHELTGSINKLVPVEAINWHDGEVNHLVVRTRNGEVNTLFPHYFLGDIVVEEVA